MWELQCSAGQSPASHVPEVGDLLHGSPTFFFKAHSWTKKEERAKRSHRTKPSIIPHVLQLSAVNSLAFASDESEWVRWTLPQASICFIGIFVNLSVVFAGLVGQ